MITYLRLKKKDAGILGGVLTEEYIQKLDTDRLFTLGAFDGSEEEGFRPVGAIIISMERGPQNDIYGCLRWLYVIPDYRELSIADQLLGRLTDICKDSGISQIVTYAPLHMVGYLTNVYMYNRYEDYKSRALNLKQILAGRINQYVKKTDPHVIPLKDLTRQDCHHLLGQLPKTALTTSYRPDEEISYVYQKNGKITASLFACINGLGQIQPIYMHCEQGAEAQLLYILYAAGQHLAQKYGPHTDICVISNKESAWKLIKYLLPDIEPEEVVRLVDYI